MTFCFISNASVILDISNTFFFLMKKLCKRSKVKLSEMYADFDIGLY